MGDLVLLLALTALGKLGLRLRVALFSSLQCSKRANFVLPVPFLLLSNVGILCGCSVSVALWKIARFKAIDACCSWSY